MKIPKNVAIAVLAIISITLAACDKGAPTVTSVPEPAGAEAPAADPAQGVDELRVVEVKFGRYVEPATFKVGGIGRKFKQSDRIFASITLDGGMRLASLAIRMDDGQGGIVATGSREVNAASSPRVNIAVTDPATALQPGEYRMDTLLDGQVVDSQTLMVE